MWCNTIQVYDFYKLTVNTRKSNLRVCPVGSHVYKQ